MKSFLNLIQNKLFIIFIGSTFFMIYGLRGIVRSEMTIVYKSFRQKTFGAKAQLWGIIYFAIGILLALLSVFYFCPDFIYTGWCR